ncbi:MAG: type II secretion system protein GspC [bacterium]
MRRLVRWWWLVNLGLLAVLAALAAAAINHRLAAEIAALPTHPRLTDPVVTLAPDRDAPEQWADAITARNLFNAHPPPPPAPEDLVEAEPEPEPIATLPGPGDPCERAAGDLKLLATMVADPAEASFAVLAEGRREGNQRLVRPGSRVDDGGVVAAIYRRRAVIWRSPDFGCLELGEDPPRARSRARPTNRARPTRRGGAFDMSKVQKTGENRYAIDKAALDEAMSDFGKLGSQIRVRPHTKDGQMLGFRVLRVQNETLFDAIGIKGGDILQAVNGNEVDSPTKALELFEKLQSSRNLTLRLERRGKPVEIEYAIK